MASRAAVMAAVIAAILSVATAAEATAALRPLDAFPTVLPGDASAASVRADSRTWLVSGRAGAATGALARRYGARAIGSRPLGAFVVARPQARAFADALRARGLLLSAYPNVVRERAQVAPAADPLTQQQWWRNAIVAPTTPTPAVDPANSPILGLVDTMPDMSHPEWSGALLTPLGALPPETTVGHGTATASVAGAPVNSVGIIGVWPGMRMINGTLPADNITCADSLVQIANLIQAGVSVINMSYGSASLCPQEYLELQFAVGAGIIPVASAGNELQEGNPLDYPASLPHVLTVGAVTETAQPAPFSNQNLAVDVTAPGTNILAAMPTAGDIQDGVQDGYMLLSGTSFSSPIAAAAVTWLRAARPRLTPDQIQEVLRLSATDIAPPGWDPATGSGLINIDRALAAEAPFSDLLEPNDDIVWIDGTAFGKKDPAVFGGRKGVRLGGRLHVAEDPFDVYRIVLPAWRRVQVSVKPLAGDADVAVYRSTAKTITQTSRVLRVSAHRGTKTDAVTVRNTSRRSRSAYVLVAPHKNVAAAAYVLTIKRRR